MGHNLDEEQVFFTPYIHRRVANINFDMSVNYTQSFNKSSSNEEMSDEAWAKVAKQLEERFHNEIKEMLDSKFFGNPNVQMSVHCNVQFEPDGI